MNRKHIILAIIALSFLTICGCDNSELLYEQEEIEVPIPKHGYIFFSIRNTNSRGTTIMDKNLNRDFAVIGYRYPSTWSAVYSQAKQTKTITYTNNDDELISGTDQNADNLMGVFGGQQNISWDSNTSAHKYTPLKQWQKNLKYSFFAWYPKSLQVNGGDNNYEGKPYLSYSLPDDKENMLDILTASRIDYTKADGIRVQFSMSHRLSALDMRAISLVNAKAVKDTFDEFKSISDDAEVTVDISNIELTLNSIFTNVTIPLCPDEKISASNKVEKTFTGFDGCTGMKYNTDPIKATLLVGTDQKLILIPQKDKLEATITLDYVIKCGNITKEFKDRNVNKVKVEISDLPENAYQYLLVSVTKSGLIVRPSVQNLWEVEDINYDFE